RTGKRRLENDVGGRVAGDEGGTFYDVDREGTVRKLPDTGPTHVQAAMMVPVKHEGRVVGVVQLMSDERTYTDEDLELVEGLVGQMGAAVRMARVHAERLRAEASEAAAQAVAAERELERAKSDFIATISHELRTPMTAVYGAARTLLRPELSLSHDQARALLEMIATQSERLAQITEEVLLASRLDRGEVTVERDRVDVAELARGTIDAMQPQLGVDVTLDAPEAACAMGDRDRIQQILINLLDNAGKYSPEGGTISVSVGDDDGHVRLAV